MPISDRIILGSNVLVYPESGPTRIARLESGGRIGDSQPLAEDPEAKARTVVAVPRAQTATEVVGRTVWAFTGGTPAKPGMAVCCTTGGDARDLSVLLSQGVLPDSQLLGVDGRGRLWLAWAECLNRCPAQYVRMVELDRETLAPGTPKTFSPKVSGAAAERFLLVCAASCRAVARTFGGTFTWAPGEGSPTKIAGRSRHLMAASSRAGRLVIAFYVSAPSGYPAKVAFARGDAKGLHLRTVSSAKVPIRLGGSPPFGAPQALFAPRGLVAVEGFGIFGVSRMAATVLR